MQHHRSARRTGLTLLLVLVTVLVTFAGPTAAGASTTGTYVALGDSYTAGPLIPNQSLYPLGCLRSDHNYPSLVSPTLGLTGFRDVSCSGATTTDMTSPQSVTPGPANPPQLNAVGSDSRIVTLGIGGNDIGFSEIVQNCLTYNPFGTPCKNKYVSGGVDQISGRIAAAGPKVASVVQGIHARSASAKVYVVGYPTVVPDSGYGCYPLVPLAWNDIPWLRAKTKELNSMLAAQASANGATYIDLYTPSRGHDFCQGNGTKWVEGLVPTSLAAPVHPNANGMAAFAGFVGSVIRANGV